MTPYPIKGLTKSQKEIFEQVATGNNNLAYFHRPAAVKKLLEIGAIKKIGEDKMGSGWATITVPVYEVPLPIHAAWCKWCDDNFDDEGNEINQDVRLNT